MKLTSNAVLFPGKSCVNVFDCWSVEGKSPVSCLVVESKEPNARVIAVEAVTEKSCWLSEVG